jgi:gas vesicle protein
MTLRVGRKGDSMNDRTPVGTSPLSLMFSFLAGVMGGATVALLLAPQSGRATRQMMRRNVTDAAGSARDLKDQAIRRGLSFRDEARHRVEDAVSALSGDGGAKLPG